MQKNAALGKMLVNILWKCLKFEKIWLMEEQTHCYRRTPVRSLWSADFCKLIFWTDQQGDVVCFPDKMLEGG